MSLYFFTASYKEPLTFVENEAVTVMLKKCSVSLNTQYNLKEWGLQVLKTKHTNDHSNKTLFLAL